MKYYVLISCLILLRQPTYAQLNNVVEVTTNGEGITMEHAVHVALRNAIEQSFGVFISSRTEILNDKLVKDELVALTNWNIQKYEVMSSLYQEDRKMYFVTVSSFVSLDNLASFIQKKGYEQISFNGAALGHNIKMMKLNELSERQAIFNLMHLGINNLSSFVSYTLDVSDPEYITGSND